MEIFILVMLGIIVFVIAHSMGAAHQRRQDRKTYIPFPSQPVPKDYYESDQRPK